MSAELTDQQAKVLAGIAKGYTNKKIGQLLGVAEKTVKAHVTAIFKVLKVKNRTQAALVIKTEHCPTCTCNANTP